MLLGHWYLVQPGLARGPIKEMVVLAAIVWPFEVAAYLWPVGMAQVLDRTVDDGFDGLLGWTWLVCAITTIALLVVTWLALRERYYSAVMAATAPRTSKRGPPASGSGSSSGIETGMRWSSDAPVRTIAPIPMRTLSLIVQPCTTAR